MNRKYLNRFLTLAFFLISGTMVQGQNPPASQLYYVPFPEDKQLEAFQAITGVAVEPMAVFVTIAAAANDTVIYYDHWEDGYEADLTNPKQPTTLIYGDGNASNGFPPGNPSDRIPAGTVFNLRNFVTTTTLASVVDYDAGDKIGAFKPITVTKTTFPGGTNTLLAGCVEMFERGLWGTDYRTPVGVNMPTSTASATLAADENLFEYTSLSISAGKGGASVQIDKDNNGVFEETVVLTEGQSVYRTGFNVGGRVLATKPVQVVLFSGEPGSTYASRDSSLLPSYRWGSEYFSPVSTRSNPKDGTVVYLYNPNASQIRIYYDYRTSDSNYATSSVLVPAGGNARVNLQPAGSNHRGAYKFYTTGATPPVFNAIGAVDADDVSGNFGSGNNIGWDGGFTLVTRSSLTTQVQVSLGIGRDPYSSVDPTQNGNPVWVTTSGNGNTASKVYVDYNGDFAGAKVDPNGNRYDVDYTVRELDQLILYDPDGDQSGMVIYSLDPGVRIAVVWAQDPSVANYSQPGLDVASLVPPMREGDAGKKSSLYLDSDGDGFVSAGDTLEYDIRAASNARANIPGPFRVRDNLPADVTYVPGTVRYRFTIGGVWQTWTNVPDDGSGTAFPLDGSGFYVPGNLQMGQQMQLTFRAVIDDYADLSGPTIVNTGDVEISPYGILIPIEWEDILCGSIGDRVWTDTNGNGAQDSGEPGIPNIRVYADTNSNGSYDSGEPFSITDSSGNYLLTGLLAGTYTVRVDSAAISAINPGYGPTFDLDGIATSHVTTVALAAAQKRTDADFGYRIGASVGDRVWMDRDGDGVQEAGEPGINGVRVYVDTNNNGTYNAGEPNTFTSGDGAYFIGNLSAGTYQIRVDTGTLPGGTAQTFDASGGLDHRAQVTFVGSEHVPTVDFGYRGTQSIGDLVWEDLDADGTRFSYNVRNGYIDINGDGAYDNNDDGSIGTVNIRNGEFDINGDGGYDNNDDGFFQGFEVINGRIDTNGDGSANNNDDANGVIFNEGALANVRVYIDSNGNGSFDANEPSATTDSAGAYSIGNLYNGTYTVLVDTSTLPSSYVPTYDLISPVGDHKATVVLSGTSRTDVDFGYRNDATLGDLVWNDRNGNGVRDAGEPGISGVVVYIDEDNDGFYDYPDEPSAITDVNGNYTIANLPPGTFRVRVEFSTLPQGATQTYDYDGTGSANSALRTLALSENATDVDFGYRSTASVGDLVWRDSNGDGIKDASESGINGIRVYLDRNGNGTFDAATEPSGVTNSSGIYSITNLVPGTYTARVDTTTLSPTDVQTYDLNGGLDHAATFSLSAGQVRTDLDFGYTTRVAIGDLVWNDVNGNGQKDPSETGLQDVGVSVINASNSTVQGTTVTNVNGAYSFPNLLPGTYYVVFDNLSGYNRTIADQGSDASDSDANVSTGRSQNITLTAGQTNNTIDAGYYQPVTIGDFVWNDVNGNGQQDGGETGLGGVSVSLFRPGFGADGIAGNADDTLVVATTASASGTGAYSFASLPPGTYQISFGALPGYRRSPQDQGADATDSDANATTGLTATFAMAAGATNSTIDAGYYQPGTISGFVLADTDNNDTGDVGIIGVTLTLKDSSGNDIDSDPNTAGVQPTTATTAANGSYSFTNLPPGSYRVVQAQPSGFLSISDVDGLNNNTIGDQTPIVVAAAQTVAGRNFIEEQTGSISGSVLADTDNNDTGDVGIISVTLTLTDSLGNDIDSDPNTPGVQPTTTTTLADGSYSFTNLPPGSYCIVQTQPSGYLSVSDVDGLNNNVIGDQTPILLAAGQAVTGRNFIEEQFGSISGSVLADIDNDDIGDNPISTVTLTLKDTSGNDIDSDPLTAGVQPMTTTTLANGTYTFSNVPPGSYRVVQSQPSGFLSVSDVDGANNNVIGDEIPILVTAGQAVTGRNFIEEQPGSISGTVLADIDNDDIGDNPIPSVTLVLKNSAGNDIDSDPNTIGIQPTTTQTAPNGTYTFANVPPGSYRVVQSQPSGYISVSDVDGANNNVIGDETTITVTAGQAVTGRDFVEEQPGSISGTVLADTDNDDDGDDPIQFVTLTLKDASGNDIDSDPNTIGIQPTTTQTAPNGTYTFTNVPPGTYQVVEADLSGYQSVTTNTVTTVTVNPNANTSGVDFVDEQLGAISGFVFVGTDPLSGVTLTLLDSSGNPVDGDPSTIGIQPITTTTQADGSYTFTNVPPGSYRVGQTQPFGYESVSDKDGGDINVIGDNTPITVSAGQTNSANNFVEKVDTCPDNWAEWKAQNPGEIASGNPDGDSRDNLTEFAFAMPANSGAGDAWRIQPSVGTPGKLDGIFTRPTGAPDNVVYTLQYASTIANPTVWTSITIIPAMYNVVNNGDCTETLTITDLETLTGLTGGKGVVRIKADLDEENDNNIDHTSYTEAEGWKVTDFGICCQTYSTPYLRDTVFTGTVDAGGVSGQAISFTGSAGTVDLGTLLTGGSYFLEVTAGSEEGHRFDIVSATGSTITVANDSSLSSNLAPFNTVTGPPSASLAGNSVVVRRHWTVDEMFPPSGFVATGDQATADQLQIHSGGMWTILHLYDDGGTPRWVDNFNDQISQGGTVIPPGHGLFFNNRNSAKSLLTYGEVRENDFIRPLGSGYSFVSGGYPISQSPTGTGSRTMSLTEGFFGSRDFKTADSFFLWKGDATPGLGTYDTYYMLQNGSGPTPSLLRWVKVGDATASPRDSEILLLENRAVFTRSAAGLATYGYPSPWTP